MKPFLALVLSTLTLTFVASAADAPAGALPSLDDLRQTGAFGFPQKNATVVCDRPDLRLSVWSNPEYLYAQAVVWNDDDSSVGKTEDNRPIGDWSTLMFNQDLYGKVTPKVDRDYTLNPWPSMLGLSYQVRLNEGSTTGLQQDSQGRGAIRYVDLAGGRRVRVDSYLIPLKEISRQTGDHLLLAYWGYSPKPLLTVNSAGYNRGGKNYYSYHIPRIKYAEYVLAKGGELDTTVVPEGRKDIPLFHEKIVPMPKVGETAPEISAKAWLNLDRPLTLAGLRGKVVVVEFWATWCGPCLECIPHLNALAKKYAGQNFQLLSFVEEGHATMDSFLAKRPVAYPIGLESSSLQDYGVSSIPHAFVINPQGKVVWEGNSADPALAAALATALKGAH